MRNIVNYIDFLKESNFLSNIFNKKEKLEMTADTWTHGTWSMEIIEAIKKTGKFIGKKENLDDFNKEFKGSFRVQTNLHAPNFYKGGFFHGYENAAYLITTTIGDDAFQPNWNAKNYNTLEESQNVGVLKPEFRDLKNFKFWKNDDNGGYTRLS